MLSIPQKDFVFVTFWLISNVDPLRKASRSPACCTLQLQPPHGFVSRFLAERVPSSFRPIHLSAPVTPTREFCIALLKAKIEATIMNLGDIIGWPSDNNVVGPFATAAKQSLLRLVPYLLPRD